MSTIVVELSRQRVALGTGTSADPFDGRVIPPAPIRIGRSLESRRLDSIGRLAE
jgi:hypothetical protein